MYLLPLYTFRYINIMNSCIKELLLVSLRSGKFALYNGETQDITSAEQMAIYETFKHNGTIGGHFVGIILINRLVESALSALENYLQSLDMSNILQPYLSVSMSKMNQMPWVFLNNSQVLNLSKLFCF